MKTFRLVVMIVFLCASGAAYGQCLPDSSTKVFDASQDLHKVKVAGVQYYDMKPNDSTLDSTPRLNAAITYVNGNSWCDQLVLDPGAYYFKSLAAGGKNYITIENTSKSFDFRNAAFMFEESALTALYISDCKKCSLSGVSIDYVHLPFTQLNVTHISNENQVIIVEPQDSSWLSPPQLYNHQSKFAKVTLYGFDTRGGIPQYGYSRWRIGVPLKNDHRLPVNPYGVVQQGDVFIVAARGGGPAIRIEHSHGGTFQNITIHTSAGPGVEEWYSDGISLIGVNIVPRPVTGASSFLVSTAAGGIELDAISGPENVVSNSVIQNAQDDSIAGNMTASNAVLYGATTDSVTICEGQTPPTGASFFVNISTGNTVGDPVNGTQYTLASAGSNTYSVSPAFTTGEAAHLLPGAAIYNVTQLTAPSYVTVENNQISNSYLARGIAFSGIGGIHISNNTITNTEQAGIYVGSSLPQNGPVIGALISGNKLQGTNLGMSGVGTGMLGAIEIMSFAQSGQTISGQPSQKVFISKNTISGTQRSGIWIANVDSGEIDSNTISDYGQAGTNLGITPHLNFGLEPYAKDAFRQQVLGWCDRNVSGITSPMCNQQLQPPSQFHCLEPGADRRIRSAAPARR